jgi:hypothetical protein
MKKAIELAQLGIKKRQPNYLDFISLGRSYMLTKKKK